MFYAMVLQPLLIERTGHLAIRSDTLETSLTERDFAAALFRKPW
jgi:hypothetical protein